ncbi:LCP family protein [Paenibacillus sp. F411]|uniref:LCP family glycopolymer transferase n=1 Tax=Paenibacillus sp. F411 TaxID=2820239 RepID=UPI001AAFE0C1|nr:LCP family protein [Paenibacillus sp. F411]MBO2944238.1 LCP family protein [Paenibacillus sp. F411]
MKRWKKLILIISAIILIGGCVYSLYLYQAVKGTMSAIYEPLDLETPVTSSPSVMESVTTVPPSQPSMPAAQNNRTAAEVQPAAEAAGSVRQGPPELSKRDPFTLAILGVDERENDVGRSDVIVVLAVNPDKHSVKMIHIPRDTRTEIVGRGTVDKINHAYAFGGVSMSIRSIEQFLDVPMDYYVKVNMEGFAQIIDLLGGIVVDNPFAFSIDGVDYPAGTLSLNGEEALLFSRMRYGDPRGDLGRNARQQQVLAAIMDQAKRLSSVTKVTDILEEVKVSTKTNVTLEDIKWLFTEYRPDLDTIERDEIQGDGAIINNIYYYIVSPGERQRITTSILQQLESSS